MEAGIAPHSPYPSGPVSSLLLMQQADEWSEPVTVHPDQLAIDVPPSGGIARFTADDEIAAYRAMFGPEKTQQQLDAAKRAKECTCGKQAAFNEQRRLEGKGKKKITGSQHMPGCPRFTKIAAVRHYADEAEVRRGF